VKLIVDEIEEKLCEIGVKFVCCEGECDGCWVFIDYVEIVVYV